MEIRRNYWGRSSGQCYLWDTNASSRERIILFFSTVLGPSLWLFPSFHPPCVSFWQLQTVTTLTVPWSPWNGLCSAPVACRNKSGPEGRCEHLEMLLALSSHLICAAHRKGDGDCRKLGILWERGGSRKGCGGFEEREDWILATLSPWFHTHNWYSGMTPGLSEDAD